MTNELMRLSLEVRVRSSNKVLKKVLGDEAEDKISE